MDATVDEPGSAAGSRLNQTDRLIDPRRMLPPRMAALAGPLGGLLAATLGVDAINGIYDRVRSGTDPQSFFAHSLDALEIRVDLTQADRLKIPVDGPLLAVANHPFGAPEALALGQALLSRRNDLLFIGNYLLERMPEMRPFTISIDPFGRRESTAGNAAALRRAVRHLKQGGAMAAFPAGEVAHLRDARQGVGESPWSPHIASLARLARCRVLPVFFPGCGSLLFNLAGLLHPGLRTLLLARETLRQRGKTLPMLIGKPIPWSRLALLRDDETLVDYLRFHTLFLQNRMKPATGRKMLPLPRPWPRRKVEPLAAAAPISLLRREIDRLAPESVLGASGPLEIRLAEADGIPMLLREIGRLREISFRGVNEGSRKAIDCDRYDSHYLHLFLWHREREEVAGAYRIGLTDRILKRFGPDGLYTFSLFHYSPEVLHHLHHALELGRSFIRPEYQRHSAALSLLWRGIGELLARRPTYRQLYGAVSIRQDYHAISKEIMVRFLRQRQDCPEWSRHVRPRCPFGGRRLPWDGRVGGLHRTITGIEDVQLLVSELESDGKGVPVLIRQYLKLNARFIDFNVDRRFSEVVDGLIHVDLDAADRRILKRFMGSDGLRRFFPAGSETTRRAGAP